MIEGMFDHRAEVWRPVEKRGFGAEVVQTLTPIARPTTGLNCAVAPTVGRTGGLVLQNIGPGETPQGRAQLFLSRTLDVQERDVIHLVAGPETGRTWRVQFAERPRDNHIEATVEPWVGEIPEDED